jgi:hypothetical protein
MSVYCVLILKIKTCFIHCVRDTGMYTGGCICFRYVFDMWFLCVCLLCVDIKNMYFIVVTLSRFPSLPRSTA